MYRKTFGGKTKDGKPSKPSIPFVFGSGMFAGSINSFLVAPVEMVRNQQIKHPDHVRYICDRHYMLYVLYICALYVWCICIKHT